jgi:predicted DNA-binding ribbon-helix-helix protein
MKMKSSVAKHSLVIAGRHTSISLEDAFWRTFKDIAYRRHLTASELAATIDAERREGNLSSAIRLFVLDFYRISVPDARDPRDRLRVA